MKSINSFNHIFLWRDFIDFRKSIDGLSALVQEQMNLDLFSQSIFVFSCRRKNKIKILYWDRTGFALWYKRLEEDVFPWPVSLDIHFIELTPQQLEWLLDGINFLKIKSHLSKKYLKTC